MFCYYRKAQYHETDQMGIIHHANYLKWMEEARVAYMDKTGMGYAEVERLHVTSPVVHIEIDYKKPVRFADEVEISVSIRQYTGIKLEIEYRFFNKTTQEVCTVASSKHCFLKDGKVISLRRELPELDAKFAAQISDETV